LGWIGQDRGIETLIRLETAMKTLILAATLASLAFTLTTPVSAATKGSSIVAFEEALQGDFDKRKKKRVKGGSGCDDSGDILEHPECR
jgi:hypothetical protein